VIVLGKGRRPRARPFGHKTAIALDRYIRARQAQKIPYLDALWLGQRKPVTDSGISQIVEKRGLKAGIEGLYPHRGGGRSKGSPTNSPWWPGTHQGSVDHPIRPKGLAWRATPTAWPDS